MTKDIKRMTSDDPNEAGSPAGKSMTSDARNIRGIIMLISLGLIFFAVIFGTAQLTTPMIAFLIGGVFLLWTVILSL